MQNWSCDWTAVPVVAAMLAVDDALGAETVVVFEKVVVHWPVAQTVDESTVVDTDDEPTEVVDDVRVPVETVPHGT